jgi:predicted Ser/Thr protein kinase
MTTKFNKSNDIINLIDRRLKKSEEGAIIPFNEFLMRAREDPILYFRNVFQLFSSMIYHYIDIEDEYKDDPESINYKTVSCERLLVKDTDTPFFADLPLANRLLRLADSFREGTQQNKIYVFIGPPGSGKSTFLNNLLRRFEEFTHTREGINYEVLWRLDNAKIASASVDTAVQEALHDYYHTNGPLNSDVLEVPCPSHDHPILIIPKEYRGEILEKLIKDNTRLKIFHKKEYEWLFTENACTICTSLYEALLDKLNSPADIFDMIFAKRYSYNRRLGYGISVFNTADKEPEQFSFTNSELQKHLSARFRNSDLIHYVYSRFARTNNGLFAIMDVKGENEKRFLNLHGIISEGVHKIDDIEENVNSLFIAVMNPEDKQKIASPDSFKDRIIEINVNYILNYSEEVKIYYHSFGTQIKKYFLPGVIDNFAKIIISSRLNIESPAIKEWIEEPHKYDEYCDENLLLLKLTIYSNKIPDWLSDEDRKKFTKGVRRKIIKESDREGKSGFSGRESLYIFNEFYNSIPKKNTGLNGSSEVLQITMEDIRSFFKKHEQYKERIPKGFIDSIIRLYNYNIMQEVKESLFHQNEERISRDIQNYLFASNYDVGEKLISPYTKETVEVTEQFFMLIEQYLMPHNASARAKKKFREDVANKFGVNLQQMQEDNDICKTEIYKELYDSYINNLREHIFQPFLQYTAFENAIKEFGTPKFEVYDNRTKEEVTFLIKNLTEKFKYSKEGAKHVCLYIIRNKIAENFTI